MPRFQVMYWATISYGQIKTGSFIMGEKTPAVNDVWENMDPREPKSRFKIESVSDEYAMVRNIATQRARRIKLSRFKPTSRGYRLISWIETDGSTHYAHELVEKHG